MSKRWFVIFYLFCLAAIVLAGLPQNGSQPKKIELPYDQLNNPLELPADTMAVIKLPSNPSTGFLWEVINPAEISSILWEVGTQNEEGQVLPEWEYSGPVRPGAPADQIMRFVGVQQGRAELVLAYRRPWENNIAEIRRVSVHSQGAYISALEMPRVKHPKYTPPPTAEVMVGGLPDHFNWAEQGLVTPVRDQYYDSQGNKNPCGYTYGCGSCWAHAACAVFEAKILKQDFSDVLVKPDINLSEQYLISCNDERWDCSGGHVAHDYHWNKCVSPPTPIGLSCEPGARSDTDFPYQACNIGCIATNPYQGPDNKVYRLDGWAYVDDVVDTDTPDPDHPHRPSVDQIKEKIYKYGPVEAEVYVGPRDNPLWPHYQGGVWIAPTAESEQTNHAVCIVGWHDIIKVDDPDYGLGIPGYWYIKNSWGKEWGENYRGIKTDGDNGYMRCAYGSSLAGRNATYVFYKESVHPPTITIISTEPMNQNVWAVCEGNTATISVTASGEGPLSYQWYRLDNNNYTIIRGATSASYTTPATAVTDDGASFYVRVFNSGGITCSKTFTLKVLTPPNFSSSGMTHTVEPASQTVFAGQMAEFTIENTIGGSTPLTFQWYKNDDNNPISGATLPKYTIPSTTAADNGAELYVVVRNDCGSVNSKTVTHAILTVLNPPASQSVCVGQSATFTVTGGTSSLSYQWYKNSNDISGATSASYTTPPTTTTDNGAVFSVKVSYAGGSVSSNPVTLTVNAPPVITNQTVCAGQTATFSVTASGTAPLSYQWYKNSAAISGATSASYTTPPTTAADNGATFSVTVSYSCGSMNSSNATLTVNYPPNIWPWAQPESKAVCAAQTATFIVGAYGPGSLSYQWYKNGLIIGGATSATYTTPPTTTADNGAVFSAKVSNSCGSVKSTNATLTVNTPPAITTQPAGQAVCAGQAATFCVTASGTVPLSYQWYKNGAAISGATSNYFTTPLTSAADNGAPFYVKVCNSCSCVNSVTVTLKVNTPPAITIQPASQTVVVGQKATFSVAAGGSAPLSYQWYKNSAAISGANSASYTTPATTIADNGASFYVKVSNTCGSANSNTVTLTITIPVVTLMATSNNKYVSADPDIKPANGLVANRSTAHAWEQFQLIDNGDGTISFKANQNGKYVCVDIGYSADAILIANRDSIGPWEKFEKIKNSDGTISLSSIATKKYVCADIGSGISPTGLLLANRTSIGPWEKFIIDYK